MGDELFCLIFREMITKQAYLSDFSDEPDEFDEFYDEVSQALSSKLKGRVSKRQIQQLCDSLSDIVNRESNILAKYSHKPRRIIDNNYNSNSMQPSINIFLQYPQQYPASQQITYYPSPQSQILPIQNPNPNAINQIQPLYMMNQISYPYMAGQPQNPYSINQMSMQQLLPSSNAEEKKKGKDKKEKKDKKGKKDKKKGKKDKKKDKKDKKQISGKEFQYTGNNQFSGIFEYLRSISSRIEDEVDVTASSSEGSRSPKVVVQKGGTGGFLGCYFNSKNMSNSWICFNFKQHKVIPKAYSIRTIRGHPNTFYPKSWVIEGSNDNNSWEIIDERNDCSGLNGEHVAHTLTIDKKSKDYQYIRMKLTGPNWNGSNHLGMESFELFGTYI